MNYRQRRRQPLSPRYAPEAKIYVNAAKHRKDKKYCRFCRSCEKTLDLI